MIKAFITSYTDASTKIMEYNSHVNCTYGNITFN